MESAISSESENNQTLLTQVMDVLDLNKAEDILHIDLRGKSAIADDMLIVTGRSNRHVVALSEFVETFLKPHSAQLKVEGKENGDWVLVDNGDMIVHIFRPEVREFYNLEKIWVDPDLLAEKYRSI